MLTAQAGFCFRPSDNRTQCMNSLVQAFLTHLLDCTLWSRFDRSDARMNPPHNFSLACEGWIRLTVIFGGSVCLGVAAIELPPRRRWDRKGGHARRAPRPRDSGEAFRL